MTLAHDPHALASDPFWFPHRFDQPRDALRLVRLDRAAHRRVTFLNEEHLAPFDMIDVPRQSLVPAVPRPAPVHFLFHSAFCGSTVLARAFDAPGLAMGLKEPMLLHDVVGIRRRGAGPAQVGQLLDQALSLLGRPFEHGEAVVIKPSNVLNALASATLAMRPQANALLLYAPLRTFLASIAKKEMWGRLWARELFVGLMRDGVTARLGFNVERLLGQTDLQIAALGWLAQQAIFADLVDRFGATRVRTLDSETLVTRPRDVIASLMSLFRLPADDRAIRAIATGPAFTQHSKTRTEFGPAARAEEYRVATAAHADEIDKVARWTEAVASASAVPMHPGAALLD